MELSATKMRRSSRWKGVGGLCSFAYPSSLVKRV